MPDQSASLDRPLKAPAIVIAKGATAGEAFVTVAWSCLNHLAHNEAVFLATRDPEALHQLRVAARRLRSDFSVFRPVWRMDSAGGRLKADLRARALPFGTLRDLDVLLESVFHEAAASSDPALRAMREQLIREQETLRTVALARASRPSPASRPRGASRAWPGDASSPS